LFLSTTVRKVRKSCGNGEVPEGGMDIRGCLLLEEEIRFEGIPRIFQDSFLTVKAKDM
jgi:hypothetical protein